MEMIENKFAFFIRALRKEVEVTQPMLVNDLFSALGIVKEADDDVIKNWMAGKNQGYLGYFKGIDIKQEHNDSFLKLLDEMIKIRYKNIQNTLRAYSNEYDYIDFETDNRDEFFKSVLNQFKVIVGLPPDQIVESIEKGSIITDNDGKASQFGTPSERMIEIFKAAIFDCGLISILRNYDPGAGAIRQAISFLETIQSKIENHSYFFDCRFEETYQNIVAFAYAVDQYNRALNTRERSTISSYAILDIEILYIWKRLVTLYGEICGSNTLFAN